MSLQINHRRRKPWASHEQKSRRHWGAGGFLGDRSQRNQPGSHWQYSLRSQTRQGSGPSSSPPENTCGLVCHKNGLEEPIMPDSKVFFTVAQRAKRAHSPERCKMHPPSSLPGRSGRLAVCYRHQLLLRQPGYYGASPPLLSSTSGTSLRSRHSMRQPTNSPVLANLHSPQKGMV